MHEKDTTAFVIDVEFLVRARDAEAAEDILRDALERNLAEVDAVRNFDVGPAAARGT